MHCDFDQHSIDGDNAGQTPPKVPQLFWTGSSNHADNKRPEVQYHPPPLIRFLQSQIFNKSTCGGHSKFQ